MIKYNKFRFVVITKQTIGGKKEKKKERNGNHVSFTHCFVIGSSLAIKHERVSFSQLKKWISREL